MSKPETRIVIIGASGMLGTALVSRLRQTEHVLFEASWPSARKDQVLLDITDDSAVNAFIAETRPDIIYNCSAFTDVDGAESQPEQADLVNGYAVGRLARAASRNDACLVHVSTDYVFSGTEKAPRKPTDPTNPQTAYGRSKLLGEELIHHYGDANWLIVRTSWLYGPNGRHFIDSILQLAREKKTIQVVNDQQGCPTYTRDLAHCLAELPVLESRGIFHFSNGPACTWYAFAREAIRIAGIDCEVTPCSTEAFPRPAPRPAYSVLDCTDTFLQLGWTARGWKETLQEYLAR